MYSILRWIANVVETLNSGKKKSGERLFPSDNALYMKRSLVKKEKYLKKGDLYLDLKYDSGIMRLYPAGQQ